ncbi:MAG: MerR family transcriptional regulator [Chitinophagaceae bacterium]
MKSVQQITFDFTNAQESENESAVKKDLDVNEIRPKKRGRKPKDPSTIIKKLPSKRGRKSLKEAESEADLIEIPEDEVLFLKQYYTMSEVAGMFRINHSLLRFWENEFDILQPKKNKKGDRFFRPVDIKNLHLIYHLLRQRKYTMEGAKEYLKNNSTRADKKFETIQVLQKIRHFLLEIKSTL